MKDYFLALYHEWNDLLEPLSDEEYGRLIRAVIDYSRGKERTRELSPLAEMAYGFITASIARSAKNRLNGQKGGLARAANARRTRENG